MKTFHTYIKKYHQFVPERLYGEWGSMVDEYVGSQSKLYIIAKPSGTNGCQIHSRLSTTIRSPENCASEIEKPR